MNRFALAILGALCLLRSLPAAEPAKRVVSPGENGRLTYAVDERGNRIPDFSHAGYAGGTAIPDGAIRMVVPHLGGDNTERIQRAIDDVSRREPGPDGLRGGVLLVEGRHEVRDQLKMRDGVVLRGCGKETVLVATGVDRRALIKFGGKADRQVEEKPRRIADNYVPVGAVTLKLDSTKGLKVGDTVVVEHPSTKEWIAAVGMDRFPTRDKGSYLDWRPGTLDIRWDRVITKIDRVAITLDAPLTSAIDAELAPGSVRRYAWPGRIRQTGIENLSLGSAFDRKKPQDEEHAWTGIAIENAEDVWVRQVSFSHFAGSAVAIGESAKRVTVSDCESVAPVSEIGGYRRHTYLTCGQQTLFLRCKATDGRHDFAVGHSSAGPNVFSQCEAVNAHQFSGPIGSWASGVLYDNVTIDGAGLALTNRETDDQGVGWAAANSMLWQCTAPTITCRKPPTAQNWAYGVWGQFIGDGQWSQLNEFVKPPSLYAAQLNDRLGAQAREILRKQRISTEALTVPRIEGDVPATKAAAVSPMGIRNGWLTLGDKLLVGAWQPTVWWRGSTLPSRATELGPGITRFVPGRVGPGFTEDLDQLTDDLRARSIAAFEHHWGLWYDRRRDDHEMMRRSDANVWAPFDEQPWARSGEGKAWNGLSRYDLTQFNSWYFNRLKQFAALAGQKELVLIQQMYFQHNILEAGAHWADFPWRPANCLQDTGFPDPPEYVGGKRVFMAEPFYDLSHAVRRDLHRRYIRHCLDVLGDCSHVIFQLGEEFTGPLPFVEFWLDTIDEWQRETGKQVRVSLSCTKDVQDAILANPRYEPLVSVIDIKYWWYTANGDLYAPEGGANLAPRQQWREWKGNKSRSDAQVARAVREYRNHFPHQALTVSLDGGSAWAVLAAGGSIPKLPALTDVGLRTALPRMKPYEDAALATGSYALADAGKDYLVWSPGADRVRLDLSKQTGWFVTGWLDLASGKVKHGDAAIQAGEVREFSAPGKGPSLLWLTRK